MVRAPGTDERGQLLLVGAIGIALVVVGTVVLVNGLAFDDSISTRSNQDALSGAERTVGMIEADLNALAREVRTGIDPGTRDFVTAFRENISLYSRHYSNLSFDNGIVYTDVTFEGAESVNGTTIRQNEDTARGACNDGNRYPRFTVENGSCESDPTIVTDATEISQFNLTVRGSGIGSSPQTTLVVEGDTGDEWRLVIEKVGPTGPIEVREKAPSGDSTVGVFTIPFELVLQDDGQLRVSGSEEVTFADGVSPPYEVGFENNPSRTALTGTYSLSTDGTLPAIIGPQPETYSTVVRPAVDIYYQRRDVTYNRTVVLNDTGAG